MLQATSGFGRSMKTTGSIATRSFSTIATGEKKERVVVLGTGWGAMNFFTELDPKKNYFTFTPLLPSVCAGTLSIHATMEPVRNFTHKRGKEVAKFYEAQATDVDFDNKKIVCKREESVVDAKNNSIQETTFTVEYDRLVVAVGAESNTFGVPGVEEYAYFLKEVEHARDVHKEVLNRFERAALPGTSDAEKKKLLSFVVVGGGPTGVETAAEFADFVKDDLKDVFPDLVQHVQITLIERGNKMLGMFSPEISKATLNTFQKLGIRTLLEHAVVGIKQDVVQVQNCSNAAAANPASANFEIPYGLALWCSGVGQVPFSRHLLNKIPAQKGNRVLTVNEKLQVAGVKDVYAIGDCAWIKPSPMAELADSMHMEYIFKQGDIDIADFVKARASKLIHDYPQLGEWKFNDADRVKGSSIEDFKTYLSKIDASYRSPAPTAQNARQEAWALAKNFNKGEEKAFYAAWKGSLAYVGNGVACMHLPMWPHNSIGGIHTLLAWKAIYLEMQMTWRNRLVNSFDWIKAKLLGRDLGRDHLQLSKLKTPWMVKK